MYIDSVILFILHKVFPTNLAEFNLTTRPRKL